MKAFMEMITRREEESRKFHETYDGNPEKLAADLTAAIQVIEKNGYIVRTYENRYLGKLDEKQPVAHEIMHSDYSTVYGFGTCDAETVMRFASDHCASTSGETETTSDAENETAVIMTAEEKAEIVTKEREYDLTYNEGGEGYNPHRTGSTPTYWTPFAHDC